MRKGQIFSLDMLISLVAVTAAVGLMIQTIEVNTYYQKEERSQRELKAMAQTVSNLLMASNEITCVNIASEPEDRFMDCIRGDVTSGEIEQLVPEGYNFELKYGATTIGGPLGAEDFYEMNWGPSISGEMVSVKVWAQ